MAAGLRQKFTNIAITSKRLVQSGPNLAWIIYYAPSIENFVNILNFEIQDGRRPPFWKNTKNSITPKPFARLTQNFNSSFISAPRRRFHGQKWNFEKSKVAADHRQKFTNVAITSKLLMRNGPNLAGIIHSERTIRKYYQNLEFWNPR